jgi:hypothetical protein
LTSRQQAVIEMYARYLDQPKTMRVITAKQGMNPAIIPIKKHQVASNVVSPV